MNENQANTTPDATQARVSAKAKKKGQKAIEKRNIVLKELEIVYVDITTLKPNDYNPNRQSDHDFELLLKSMTEDGFTQPVLVQEKTNIIVDGEHRWRAAQTLKYDKIPVVYVDMDLAQAKIATLRHNRARGAEDLQLTANLLRDLQELGAIDWAQDSLMMDDIEMQRLLEDVSAPDALASENFGEAWRPDDISGDTARHAEAGETTYEITDDKTSGKHVHSVTDKAASDIRDQEKIIKEASSQEEKNMATKKRNLYRLSLVFSGDEAAMVKKALGGEPAAVILDMCKQRVEQ